MKILVFSVYDKAVKAFLPPFYARAKGEAIRSFISACNDEKHNFKVHASDYVLYQCGTFDDVSGLFEVMEPDRILSALECLNVVQHGGNGRGESVSDEASVFSGTASGD